MGRPRYLAAGICAGLAIGFKQYALLLVPLSLYYAFRKSETRSFLPYMAGVALPLVIMFAALFAVYGAEAGTASLYWSFGVTPTYFTEGSIGEVSAYHIGDPAEAAGWVTLALSPFAPLVALAAAGIVRKKCSPEEELFIIAAVVFAAILAIRPFLHCWAFSLPFIALLAAGAFGKVRAVRRRLPGTMALFLIGGTICAALLSAAAFMAYQVMTATWRPLSITEQYGLADIVLKATAPYFGNVPSPIALDFGIDLSSSPPPCDLLPLHCCCRGVYRRVAVRKNPRPGGRPVVHGQHCFYDWLYAAVGWPGAVFTDGIALSFVAGLPWRLPGCGTDDGHRHCYQAAGRRAGAGCAIPADTRW
jgi:hypothetical protein